MVSADAKAASAFIRGARASGLPFTVFAVWYAIIAHIERDTGVVSASQRRLAKTCEMAVGDVHRAIEKLVEMGVLIREARGRYRVHPSVMWNGQLELRGKAEEASPTLTLIPGGRSE